MSAYMKDLVWGEVVGAFEVAYPGVGITSPDQQAYHSNVARQYFDGLLEGLLRQHYFAEMFFRHRAPEALRFLKAGTSPQQVRDAFRVVAGQPHGGAFVAADGFGLKRANKGGNLARGNLMLKRMETALIERFPSDLIGRLNIGDEFVLCSDGPPAVVHEACDLVNLRLREHLVEGLPTRLDFGVAEYHTVASTCLRLMGQDLGYQEDADRPPVKYFHRVGLDIAWARAEIMKRFELLVLVWVSLKMKSLGERSGEEHSELVSSLLRPGEVITLPDESWLDLSDEAVPVFARAQTLAGLSLPADAGPYKRIIHEVAEHPFLENA